MGRKRTRTKVTLRRVDFDGPAKTADGQEHIIEKFAEGSSGTARRFKNVGEHPLLLAHARHQITDDQFAAGNTFRDLFEQMQRSGRDSTVAMASSRTGAQPLPFTDTQVVAITTLKRIEQMMAARNYRIVRRFCGEAVAMVEAVQRVTACHPSGVKYRMQEALEDLDDALEKLRVRRLTA